MLQPQLLLCTLLVLLVFWRQNNSSVPCKLVRSIILYLANNMNGFPRRAFGYFYRTSF